ncbi:methylated-DNA--[protein]-cysteine S-methyltransferase [Corynebacterium sp. Q4381]|uniref:methylated-DNA--[protein]-cysteine S-methyltransferase n=1 Tax=Corynebacterium sp. Marseille-Q4381 TaxID=3121597 RepID=UPI002FE55A09
MYTYRVHDTPVGPLTSVCSPNGLVRVGFGQLLADGAVKSDHADVDKQLAQFFSGQRRTFDLPLDWSLTSGVYERMQRALLTIPYGETATYAELAKAAGAPRAARAAGTACARNPLVIVVPCHRVVRAGGAIGQYGGGVEMKKFLLEMEARFV